MNLTRRIFVAMTLAIVFGSLVQWLTASTLLPSSVADFMQTFVVEGVFDLGGQVFLSSLKLLVVPLVFVSLVCGVCQLQDQSSIGRISLKTLLLYLVTTSMAISLALFIASWWQPGTGIEMQASLQYQQPEPQSFFSVLLNIFPTNPIAAMAEANMLQVIVFALLIGVAIGRSGEAGERLGAHFRDWDAALMSLTTLIINLAPYGVFCLLFTLFARQGLETVGDLLLYMVTVVSVLLLHCFLVYPILLRTLTKLSPFPFLRKIRSLQLFAFSTATSTATIPVTLNTAEKKLGVESKVSSFVVPLGATINMDGTAIMQGVATVFIAQAYGLDLSMLDYLLVVLTATMASIGTAGVPGVGLVTLAMVLQQVNIPVEGIALIIGVDRLLDMLRTAVNVTGDTLVALIVGRSEKAFDQSIYDNPTAGEKTT